MKNNCVRLFAYIAIFTLLLQTSPTQALPNSIALETVPESIEPQGDPPEPLSMPEHDLTPWRPEPELPEGVRNPRTGSPQPAEEREYIPPTAAELALTAAQVRTFDCTTVADLLPVECEALVALYGSTNGAGWANNTNWLVTTTAASWFGVVVSGGHVLSISMYGNLLSGIIPLELSYLSNLMTLHLGGNQLSGSIPTELGNLSNLVYLYLYSNQLSGIIPTELGNLNSLEKLSLSDNQLTGSVPSVLSNLSSMDFLTLDNNQLIGSIPLSFVNLTPFYYFSFYNTNLCEPNTPEFLAWKANVVNWYGTDVICPYSICLPLIVR